MAKIEKSPAFQFYPKDYLTDAKVMAMTPEMRGLYVTLLCVDWLEDGFPENQLMKLAGYDWLDEASQLRDLETCNQIQAHLQGCFVKHPTKRGFITNPRLQKERTRQAEWRRKSQEGGQKSAELRQIAKENQGKGGGKGGCQMVATKVEPRGQPKANTSSSSSSPIDKSTKVDLSYSLAPPARPNLPISPSEVEALKAQYGGPQVEAELDTASDWLTSTGRKYKNYPAFFRNWMRRSAARPVNGIARGAPPNRKPTFQDLNPGLLEEIAAHDAGRKKS